jgi:hypothetical protein
MANTYPPCYEWPAADLIPKEEIDELVAEGIVKYPNARLKINARESLAFSNSASIEEFIHAWDTIQIAALIGEFDRAVQFPFIEKVFKGVHPGRARKRIPAQTRRQVLAAGMCADCGSTANLTIDHIRPITKGGTDHRRNLQCLCLTCNMRKGNLWRGRR